MAALLVQECRVGLYLLPAIRYTYYVIFVFVGTVRVGLVLTKTVLVFLMCTNRSALVQSRLSSHDKCEAPYLFMVCSS